MPNKNLAKIYDDESKRRSLSLVVTRSCNLNCNYCYEKTKQHNKNFMEFDVAKNAITHYMNAEDGLNTVSIEFFGGEPLLAFPLIKNIVEWFLSKSWNKRAFFGIATNGTLLTDEIKSWLEKYARKMSVGFSIDGCKEAHDLNRSNSYDLVHPNIAFFKKNWPMQPAKFTINDRTIPYIAKSIIHLEELEINFNGGLVLENIWGENSNKEKLLEIYEEQLAILLDFYEKRPDLTPPSPLFSKLPEYIWRSQEELQLLKNETNRFCGAGNEMVTIDIDGKEYPCHRFLPLCTGKESPEKISKIDTEWKPEKCNNCQFIPSCPTCVGFNYQDNGDPWIRTTYHCEAFKLGILASCKLEAFRLSKMTPNELKELPKIERTKLLNRLEAILHIIKNGI